VPGGERYPPAARLRSSRAIRATLREGRRFRAGPLEIFARPSPAGRPRVGLVVPRHGRTIVERNRLKRQLREIVRREWLPAALEEGRSLDVVVRARPRAYDTGFQELRSALLPTLHEIPCSESSSG